MLKVEEEGDVILVEKCFVILGTIPEEQSILLCALKQVIDLERKVIIYVQNICNLLMKSLFILIICK